MNMEKYQIKKYLHTYKRGNRMKKLLHEDNGNFFDTILNVLYGVDKCVNIFYVKINKTDKTKGFFKHSNRTNEIIDMLRYESEDILKNKFFKATIDLANVIGKKFEKTLTTLKTSSQPIYISHAAFKQLETVANDLLSTELVYGYKLNKSYGDIAELTRVAEKVKGNFSHMSWDVSELPKDEELELYIEKWTKYINTLTTKIKAIAERTNSHYHAYAVLKQVCYITICAHNVIEHIVVDDTKNRLKEV